MTDMNLEPLPCGIVRKPDRPATQALGMAQRSHPFARDRIGQQSRERAAKNIWPDYRIKFPPSYHSFDVTPDGKWVLASIMPGIFQAEGPSRLIAIPLQKGPPQEYGGGPVNRWQPGTSQDGKYLLLKGSITSKVPLADGKPDWSGLVVIADRKPNSTAKPASSRIGPCSM